METKNLTIKKAVGGKVIVEDSNGDPRVYDNISDVVMNEFFSEKMYEMYNKNKSFTLSTSIEFNPPKESGV